MAINPFKPGLQNPFVTAGSAPSSPAQGDTHYNAATAEWYVYDGSQWIPAWIQGVGPNGTQLNAPQGAQGVMGIPGPYFTANSQPTFIPPATPSKPRPEWEPFFAVWPRRTIKGKLRVGPIFRRTQVYEEMTDFSSCERITITSYATKKETFVWKMKYCG